MQVRALRFIMTILLLAIRRITKGAEKKIIKCIAFVFVFLFLSSLSEFTFLDDEILITGAAKSVA